MAPSYRKVCKTLMKQKQLADERNSMLQKKVHILEKKSIELETWKAKCDIISRENLFLNLELKEFRKSLDPKKITNLETKPIQELMSQILTLTTEVSILGRINTELWVENRRVAREIDTLKLSPLSMICYNSKNCIAHPAKITIGEDLSSIFDHEDATTWIDSSVLNTEDFFVNKDVERKQLPVAMHGSPCCFSTPVKKLNVEIFQPRAVLVRENRIPTPPFAVIPPWCLPPAEGQASADRTRSMIVSTTLCSHSAENSTYATYTATDESTLPFDSTFISTTFEEIDDTNRSPDANRVATPISKKEIDDVDFDGYSSSTSYKRVDDGTRTRNNTILSPKFVGIDGDVEADRVLS